MKQPLYYRVFYKHIKSGHRFVAELYKRYGKGIDALGAAIMAHSESTLLINDEFEELADFMDGNGFVVDWNQTIAGWYMFYIEFPQQSTTSSTESTYSAGDWYVEVNSCLEEKEFRNEFPRQKHYSNIFIQTERYDEVDQPP